MNLDHCIEKKFIIRNKLGLHARPAALFVRTANRYQSQIWIQKGKQKVNGKSIMGVMMLAACPKSRITVSAKGLDAQNAMDELEKLITSNFGESE